MSEAPERIWAFLDGPMVGLFVSGGHKANGTEYRRADASLTPAEAVDRCEAVAALVDAVRHEREMACQDMGLQMAASEAVGAALAPFTEGTDG